MSHTDQPSATDNAQKPTDEPIKHDVSDVPEADEPEVEDDDDEGLDNDDEDEDDEEVVKT